jgi:hypothetical protein
LRIWPGQVTELITGDSCCRAAATPDGINAAVPKSVPKRGPTTIIRQSTPTKKPIKNGPEIVDFRPVL